MQGSGGGRRGQGQQPGPQKAHKENGRETVRHHEDTPEETDQRAGGQDNTHQDTNQEQQQSVSEGWQGYGQPYNPQELQAEDPPEVYDEQIDRLNRQEVQLRREGLILEYVILQDGRYVHVIRERITLSDALTRYSFEPGRVVYFEGHYYERCQSGFM